ncbi:hypothetical protein K402DRAFT_401274 [Aulographum hederae CBS 113979]|uniref:Uncharacterized protein n=1 Tax=Aulographum hederae CBS 113979 TaxID=1176131 RepID=A0A6G1HBM0_9PEZI|nr:hypothetical protein K402DRAFT_401274 [Aulographum hederae CBS 113979]
MPRKRATTTRQARASARLSSSTHPNPASEPAQPSSQDPPPATATGSSPQTQPPAPENPLAPAPTPALPGPPPSLSISHHLTDEEQISLALQEDDSDVVPLSGISIDLGLEGFGRVSENAGAGTGEGVAGIEVGAGAGVGTGTGSEISSALGHMNDASIELDLHVEDVVDDGKAFGGLSEDGWAESVPDLQHILILLQDIGMMAALRARGLSDDVEGSEGAGVVLGEEGVRESIRSFVATHAVVLGKLAEAMSIFKSGGEGCMRALERCLRGHEAGVNMLRDALTMKLGREAVDYDLLWNRLDLSLKALSDSSTAFGMAVMV